MTKRHNMTKGERQEALEKRVASLEMAVRVSQMLLQQMGGSLQPLSRDLGELANRQRDLQYKVLAFQALTNLDAEAVNAKAEELNLKDFEEASAKEDAEKGYTSAEVIAEDSIVILSSVAEKAEKSILRSKLMVEEIGFPQLKADLLGKKRGDKISADVSGVQHEITILDIKTAPAKLEVVSSEEAKA